MRYHCSIVYLFVLGSLLSACSKKYNVYKSPQYINYKHTKVAVLPFYYELTTGFSKTNYDVEKQKNMETENAYEVQAYVFSQIMKVKEEIGSNVELQPIEETNLLLAEGKITPSDLKNVSLSKLAKELNVDEVIYGRIREERPVSDVDNLMRSVLFGTSAIVNGRVEILTTIYNQETDSLMWKFDSFRQGAKFFKDKLKAMVNALPYFFKSQK